MRRRFRVWSLTARRGAHWVVVKVRGTALDERRRAELEEQFAIRSAEDVTRELGQLKGVVMKLGQVVSYLADALPPAAAAQLATLQANAPPMAPSLASSVVEDELGAPPDALFLDWEPVPVAAASIGQVHRAVLDDGRRVAVKVQYPNVADAIGGDLEDAHLISNLVSAFTFKGLDVDSLVDEVRERITAELDYRSEAENQRFFSDRYEGHPFVSVPGVVAGRSASRVLTADWADGAPWERFCAEASGEARQLAAEALFRFTQGSVYGHGVFNADPNPGNYLFGDDGSIAALDFGLVKRFGPGETDRLWPLIDPLLASDHDLTVERMIAAGFLAPDHGLEPRLVWEFVSRPYVPYLGETFTFSRSWVGETLKTLLDVRGPYRDVVERLNMPASFVFLDRVVWGVSAMLGRLGATNRWRAILDEYRLGEPPSTELGRAERAWRDETGRW
ncbi:MAG: AarF/ABC1/UbiB kinase family protein [Actinomycetota bacterium]|nr:AarF/ABC1/UbiB kinase family protein [Actinomycetota bacterium]